MIFQHFNLADSKTVYKNISFVLEAAGYEKDKIHSRVTELLDFVNISDKADAYPSKLSGGQKQRVAIARALANNTKILLCDEPTSALDAETTSTVLELLKKANKELGITIIIITHELDVVKKICGRVAVMTDGKIAEIGEVYDVFTNSQNEFTKQLLEHSHNFEIPVDIINNADGPIIKLVYQGENAAEAVLSDTAVECDVRYNILHGKIEYIGEKPVGILIVNIIGNEKNIKSALEILNKKLQKTEVIRYA